MADPISLMAIAGLVYAGRKMSDPPATVEEPPFTAPEPPLMREEPDTRPSFVDEPKWVSKQEHPSFGEIAPQQRSSGTEILNMRNRMYDNGRMNNLSPVEKQLVGPGLGVGADTPATGGFQQMYRVNPINVGEYRLTQLEARTNHGWEQTGGKRQLGSILQHNRPEKTAFLHERLPPVKGRSHLSGVTPRNEHEKTKRPTNRSQTGLRNDGLSNAPAKRFISAQAVPQLPTRFKSDINDAQFEHFNNPQPGISNFHGGYETSAAANVGKSDAELMALGFRIDDKRGKAGRAPNRGRMNVRESALKQGGRLTSVRLDTTRVDGRVNAANGGWMQDYRPNDYHQFNAYKGQANPYASAEHLNSTKEQLKSNPYAQVW
jgi:hypothetical protein